MTQLEELNQKLLTCQQLTARYPNRYQLEAAIARGLYRRVTRGFYLHRADWDKLTPEEIYQTRLLALAASTPGIIFSHQTAALLHGLPLENLPETVHVYCYRRTRAKDYTVHHGELHLPTDTTVLTPGLRMTSLERTLADLAEQPGLQRHRIKL